MLKNYQFNFELRHLRYFCVLAETLHFHQAAKHLHISQPSLSRQIQDLEAAMGVPLFNRTNRQVTLTDAGQAFYQDLQQLLDQLDASLRRTQRAARGEWGEIALTFTEVGIATALPAILRTFKRQFPHVDIKLTERPTAEQLEALLSGQVDCAFLHPVGKMPDEIEIRTIWRDTLGIVLPASHPLAERKEIRLADLKSKDFILFPRSLNSNLYDHIIAICQQAGFYPKIVAEVARRQNSVNLVAAEMGLTFLGSSLKHLCGTATTFKPLAGVSPQLQLAYSWRKDNNSVILSQFLKIVQSALEQINQT